MARAGLGPTGAACSPTISTRARARPTPPTGAARISASPMSHRFAPPICPDAPISPGPRFPARICRSPAPGAGLDGKRSGAFWGFCAVMRALTAEGRAPRLIVLENVDGVLTSQGRRGFRRHLRGASWPRLSLRRADDRRGAFSAAIAAARVLRRAVRSGFAVARGWSAAEPPAHHASPALRRAAAALPPRSPPIGCGGALPSRRAPTSARRLPRRRTDESAGTRPARTARLLAALSPASRRDVAACAGERRARGRRPVSPHPPRRRGRRPRPGGSALRRSRGLPAHAGRRLEPPIPDRCRGRPDPHPAHEAARGGAAHGPCRTPIVLPAARPTPFI